jgi:integrase/recombinase XerC
VSWQNHLALALRTADLDPDQCPDPAARKGRDHALATGLPTLMRRLIEHGEDRHAPRDGQLLRYTSGRPITYRRYDRLVTR